MGILSAQRKLNLLVLQGGVLFDVGTTGRELDTVAFELLTVGNGAPWGGVLVQNVDLLEG
jgi:hypothetical protein